MFGSKGTGGEDRIVHLVIKFTFMGKVTIGEKDSLISGDVMLGEMKISSPASCFVGNKNGVTGLIEV